MPACVCVCVCRGGGGGVVFTTLVVVLNRFRSERIGKTGVSGTLLNEAKYINISLHFLEQVGVNYTVIIHIFSACTCIHVFLL